MIVTIIVIEIIVIVIMIVTIILIEIIVIVIVIVIVIITAPSRTLLPDSPRILLMQPKASCVKSTAGSSVPAAFSREGLGFRGLGLLSPRPYLGFRAHCYQVHSRNLWISW